MPKENFIAIAVENNIYLKKISYKNDATRSWVKLAEVKCYTTFMKSRFTHYFYSKIVCLQLLNKKEVFLSNNSLDPSLDIQNRQFH